MTTRARYRTNTLRLICTCSVLVCSFGLIFGSLFSIEPAKRPASKRLSYQAAELVEMLGDNAHNIRIDRIAVDLPCDRAELDRYISWVAAPGPNESSSRFRSRQLHAARLVAVFGGTPEWVLRRQSPLMDPVKLRPVDHVKLHAEDFLLTWRGLEAAETASGERTEHRDQTLSALAELGIELNSTIESKDGILRVADLLAASINEFHLDQKEISWTLSAYASYLPPQTVWWNRYGEEFSFDTAVQEMMERKLNRESCRGLHLVTALTRILRVDRDVSILAPEVRERLNAYVRGKLSEAIEAQLEDGSWPLLWSRSGFLDVFEYTPEATDINRVMVSGHLLEWFHMLPKDIKPPANVVRDGSLWVLRTLRSAPAEAINKEFCPYTHALRSLYIAQFQNDVLHGT